MEGRLRSSIPGGQTGRIAPGSPAADEALGQIPARDIEMSKDAAQLSGREQS